MSQLFLENLTPCNWRSGLRAFMIRRQGDDKLMRPVSPIHKDASFVARP